MLTKRTAKLRRDISGGGDLAAARQATGLAGCRLRSDLSQNCCGFPCAICLHDSIQCRQCCSSSARFLNKPISKGVRRIFKLLNSKGLPSDRRFCCSDFARSFQQRHDSMRDEHRRHLSLESYKILRFKHQRVLQGVHCPLKHHGMLLLTSTKR